PLFRQDAGHLARLGGESGKALTVLVVDRFEQGFASRDKQERDAFIGNLIGLTRGPGGNVVILIVKSDFLSHVARVEALEPFFRQGEVFVAFDTKELRQAIEEPARAVGLKFEEGLVDRLLLDVQGDPGAITLLQFTLVKLWERRKGNRITWEAYN